MLIWQIWLLTSLLGKWPQMVFKSHSLQSKTINLCDVNE